MHGKADPNAEIEQAERSGRVREIMNEYLARRAQGNPPSRHELLAAHANLAAELADEFAKLDVIDQARRGSAQEAPTVELRRVDTDRAAMALRCPHCHDRFEVDTAKSLDEVRCDACGERFEVVASASEGGPPTRRIGRFELIERLGQGGFGAVWRARDEQLDRDVAIKIPLSGRVEPGDLEEFVREARFAARLNHPHIVTIYEVGRDGDTAYIVSDLIDGQQLNHWAEDQSVGFRDAARVCRQVALALEHAHQRDVVHRDLKPANIMIDSQGQPHLTDFGLAKQTSADVTVTLDGYILGTVAYMSPEQARGEPGKCDRRSDVYSLGVVIFELLTGELPFRGNMSVLPHKVVHDEPPSLRRLNDHVPHDLETICLKCLEKAPRQRYQTAARLAEDLGNWLQGMPIAARPVGRLGRLWRWSRRHRLVAGFMAAMAATLLLMTASLLALRPIWQARLAAEEALILMQSRAVLTDLEFDQQVAVAAKAAANDAAVVDELEQPYRARVTDDAATRQFLQQQITDVPGGFAIEVVNWFVLDNAGRLRASSDPDGGKRVVGQSLTERDYYRSAVASGATIFRPYHSRNDGRYKVPVSVTIGSDEQPLGVLVAAISTPGTRALDDQRLFIRDLRIGSAVAAAPLAIFVIAIASAAAWRRLRPTGDQGGG